MLDIKYIRENIELVKENLKKKFQEQKSSSVDKLLKLDIEYRKNIKIVNELKHKKNKITEQIGILKRKNEPIDELLKQAKKYPEKIKELDQKQKELKQEIIDIQKKIPNIISPETVIGKDESKNKEIQKFGEPKNLDFNVKNHTELAESLNLVSFDASRDVSGKGFYYLKGDLALLSTAIINFARDFLNKKNYTYILPPLMINKEACEGVIDFEFFKEAIYKVENNDLYLIGTSEHPLIAMFINKIIPEEKLPIKMYGFSSCFRKEIGSHGVDERGLFRLHQFDKVEQVILCKPGDSIKMFDELLNNTISIFGKLEIPIRTLEICSGDLGDSKYRQIDIEAYSPRKKKYFEVGSCSNLTSSQALGLNIKAKTKTHDKFYVHTLNNTAVATPRILVAVIENYQTKEGTIKIPKVLQSYMFGKTEIKKNKSFF